MIRKRQFKINKGDLFILYICAAVWLFLIPLFLFYEKVPDRVGGVIFLIFMSFLTILLALAIGRIKYILTEDTITIQGIVRKTIVQWFDVKEVWYDYGTKVLLLVTTDGRKRRIYYSFVNYPSEFMRLLKEKTPPAIWKDGSKIA